MLDHALCDEIIAFFSSMLEFYKSFLSLESQKYTDVANGSLETLNAHMSKEQAFVLKARGLEQDRQQLMEKAGIPKATFREMIAQFPDEKRDAANRLYTDISNVTGKLRQTNINCNRLIKVKLGHVSKILSVLKDHPELRRIYGTGTESKATEGIHFSEKI